MSSTVEDDSFVTQRKKSSVMPHSNDSLEPLSDDTEQPDSELSLPTPIQFMGDNQEDMMHVEGNMTIPVAMFQSFVNKADSQFDFLRQELHTLKTMQTQIDEVNDMAAEALDMANTNTDEIESLKLRVQSLEEKLQQTEIDASETKLELNKMNRELKSVKDTNSSFGNYLRRDNLLFMNVQSAENENCEKVIRSIFATMGFVDSDSIKLVKCHRLKIGRAPFPILCSFLSFEDRQRVFDKKTELKGSRTFIEEHFSDATHKIRRALLPIQLAAKKLKMKSFLKYEKVVIEGKAYGLDDIKDLPDSLQYVATCCKQNNNAVAFYGERSPLSNFYKSSFMENGTMYHSTEMYLQYQKALFFQDEITAFKILASKSPAQAKALSYQIKGVNQAAWEVKAPDIMKKGLELKFNSDGHCKMTLLKTGTRVLGEATASDKFWGTGVALFDSMALNHGAWQGQNNMGKLLHDIRERISF